MSQMQEARFVFWNKFLSGVCVLFIFVGIFMAVFPDSFLFSHWTHYFNLVFGVEGVLTPEQIRVKNFMAGMLGGTIAGFYLMAFMISNKAFRKKEVWAYWAILLSLILWFVVDSSMTLIHGAYFNFIIINCFTLVMQGLPLIFTRKYFFK